MKLYLDEFIPGVIAGFALGVLTICCLWSVSEKAHKAEAIKVGVAEYRVIDEYGDTEFRWITNSVNREFSQ
jgi:hypothetical protein